MLQRGLNFEDFNHVVRHNFASIQSFYYPGLIPLDWKASEKYT